MKKIAYSRPDGGVSVITPAENIYTNGTDYLWFRTLKEVPQGFHAATIEEIAQKDVPEGLSWNVIDESELPQDGPDRHAWALNDGKIEIDQIKVQAKIDEQNQKEADKQALLSKLGIEKSDIAPLKEILKDGDS